MNLKDVLAAKGHHCNHRFGQVEHRRGDPHHARRGRRGDGARRRGCPVGIFTERDVVRLYADGDRDFDKLPVAARMTCSVVLGRLSMPVDEALGLMTERRFRHLPVNGKLLGLVSIGDLVKVKLDEAAQETQALRAYIASLGLPLAPAAQQKVKPAACAVEGGGVGIELRLVTRALFVEERFEAAAFVAARLEVHDPAIAGCVAEQAVDYVAANTLSATQTQAVLAARLRMRTEQPASFLVFKGNSSARRQRGRLPLSSESAEFRDARALARTAHAGPTRLASQPRMASSAMRCSQ